MTKLVAKIFRPVIEAMSQKTAQIVGQHLAGLPVLPSWQSVALAERQLLLTAKGIEAARAGRSFDDLRDAEYKVFSQFGEDGIIQYLLKAADMRGARECFVEFGVESYSESTTRFLMTNNNWSGLVMDGSREHVDHIRAQEYYWRHELRADCAFITRENINSLISSAGISGDIGLLCVDIDGNDYWVWQAIDVISPVIVVAEWNSVFGPQARVTVPYDPSFVRGQAQHSNLYYGASIAALESLASQKGYARIGSNSAGNNLFFVRRDRLGSLRPRTAAEAYVESRFRESRGPDGRLTYLSGRDRLAAIADMPIHDLDRDGVVALRDVFPSAAN